MPEPRPATAISRGWSAAPTSKARQRGVAADRARAGSSAASARRTDRAVGRGRGRHRPRAGQRRASADADAALLDDWLALFPDRFYLELQRLGRPDEEPTSPAPAARGAPRRAGGRHQRRALPQRRRLRGARGAGVHPRRRAARRSGASAPLHAASSTCAAPRRWRRCSPTCPRRSRTRWRSRAAAACG